MFCPKCGTKNDDNATFCASCGSALKGEAPSTPGMMSSPAPSMAIGSQMDSSSKMDVKGAFQDAIALVKNPKAFMTARADTAPPVKSTIMNYVAILALVPFLFTLLGDLIFRTSHSVVYAVVAGIIAYIFALVSVVVVGYIMSMLAPRFMSTADVNKSTKLVSYLYTPVFLIAILNIVPGLVFIGILGTLYGLYIVYLGLPIVLKTPQNKVVIYLVATLVVTFVVYAVLAAIAVGIAIIH